MANRTKDEAGRRLNLQLPASAYQTTTELAAKRNLSISEFVRRSVEFQAWLEKIMPGIEGFAADELAKIQLAHERLETLEQQRIAVIAQSRRPPQSGGESRNRNEGTIVGGRAGPKTKRKAKEKIALNTA